MKKLAYIILIIAILLIISHFVKNGAPVAQETTADTTINIESNVQSQSDTSQTNEVPNKAPTEDSDVVDVQENVEDIIISDEEPEDHGAVDVEETSEETTDEEETVLPE